MLAKHSHECWKCVHPPSNPSQAYGMCSLFPYLRSRVSEQGLEFIWSLDQFWSPLEMVGLPPVTTLSYMVPTTYAKLWEILTYHQQNTQPTTHTAFRLCQFCRWCSPNQTISYPKNRVSDCLQSAARGCKVTALPAEWLYYLPRKVCILLMMVSALVNIARVHRWGL